MGKRDLLILLLAMAIAVAVAVTVFSGSALETASWGLSFRQEGAPPIGQAYITFSYSIIFFYHSELVLSP